MTVVLAAGHLPAACHTPGVLQVTLKPSLCENDRHPNNSLPWFDADMRVVSRWTAARSATHFNSRVKKCALCQRSSGFFTRQAFTMQSSRAGAASSSVVIRGRLLI